jgi:uncharacterized protein YggU (UPF0235/DUF167 family)
MKLQVRVKPGSRASLLEEQPDGSWVARIRSAPVDGNANAELIGLVARRFGVPRMRVRIRSGAAGRAKLIEIED